MTHISQCVAAGILLQIKFKWPKRFGCVSYKNIHVLSKHVCLKNLRRMKNENSNLFKKKGFWSINIPNDEIWIMRWVGWNPFAYWNMKRISPAVCGVATSVTTKKKEKRWKVFKKIAESIMFCFVSFRMKYPGKRVTTCRCCLHNKTARGDHFISKFIYCYEYECYIVNTLNWHYSDPHPMRKVSWEAAGM